MIRPNAAPSRLDPLSYERRRQQILRRDGWRCQSCGTMSNLEVHHRKFRSHSGVDAEENLITLCVDCHRRAHELRQRFSSQRARVSFAQPKYRRCVPP